MTYIPSIAFLATSRSGLGHLRRIANIAAQVKTLMPQARLMLVTNETPAGLAAFEIGHFAQVVVCETTDMSSLLERSATTLAVVDTMRLPRIGTYSGRAVLILRETPTDRIARLAREDGKPWDAVILPNAPDHWTPDLPPGFADKVDAAGWILRPAGCRTKADGRAGIVLATGGGGSPDTRAVLYPLLSKVFAETRKRTPFTLRQALGPRAAGQALPDADEVFDPGADLNRVFRAADVVISTAGYNSVLELASCDTPALILPIPRSLDDQTARVRLWGPRLGFGLAVEDLAGDNLDGEDLDAAARWLADQIATPRRRPPVDLGPDGAAGAARILTEMLCPVS